LISLSHSNAQLNLNQMKLASQDKIVKQGQERETTYEMRVEVM
jgi:hypothetical protein